MTVKELRIALQSLPDNMLVILAKDSGGNNYSPLYESDSSNNVYVPNDSASGDIKFKELTPELEELAFSSDDVNTNPAGKDCVVLWPTN